MNAIEVLEQIGKTPKRSQKESILKEWQAMPLLRMYLQYALDSRKVYHVANLKCPNSAFRATPPGADVTHYFVELFGILDQMASGELSGNDARYVIGSFLRSVPADVQKWAYRCVMKNPDIGIGVKTVNACMPGLLFDFKVALARQLYSDGRQFTDGSFKLVIEDPLKYWVDPKIDGVRCICVRRGTDVTLYSRNGTVLNDTLPSMVQAIANGPDTHYVLDGELMANNWNETQSILFSKRNRMDDEGMVYNVFDWLPIDRWDKQYCPEAYWSRRQLAEDCVKKLRTPRVRMVEGRSVKNLEELRTYYEETVSQKYEGIMVKDTRAGYSFKRSRAIMKVKPNMTVDGRIVGWERGAVNSKWQNGFGAFLVDVGGVITSVGGGFSDIDRAAFHAALHENTCAFNGRPVEIFGQELTKDGKIRFPVFKGFRDVRDSDPMGS